jgi:putative nucleotidyltransferase with HDIG domain
MGAAVTRPVQVHDARVIAQVMLGAITRRWRHTIAVARRAEEISTVVPPGERELLVAAAWLHDIGYAGEVADTGFHPLDGARFLDRHLWPGRLTSLVAHHSGARFVAAVHGLDEALRHYPRQESVVADALTYADQTTGPDGERMTVEERIADALRRHGPDAPNARVHHVRGPFLLATAWRVEQRLAALAP